MFVRAIFLAGFLVIAAALALGALVSGGGGSEAPDLAQPPASAIDEAPSPEPEPPTATPIAREARREEPTPTSTPRPRQPTPTPTSQPPTQPPAPSATASPPSNRDVANFTGVWTVLYTITAGAGIGQSYSFDVSLEQNGRRISGGNDGIRVDGTADGQTATLTYRQPALGYTATFTWTLVNGSWGGGAFTSAVNSGTSLLQRIR